MKAPRPSVIIYFQYAAELIFLGKPENMGYNKQRENH